MVLSFAAACAQLLGGVEIDPGGELCRESTIGGLSTRICDELPADAGPPPKQRICEFGLTKCEGRLLRYCTDDGTAWATLQACATPALCESSDIATIPTCKAPTCGVEQMSCEGNVLRLCNEDRTGWEEFAVCETAAHCDPVNRQCLDAPCDPGARRCNLGQLERCNATQTDWERLDACASNELCEATLQGMTPGMLAGGTAAGDGPPPMLAPPPAADSDGPIQCLRPICLPNQVQCDGVRLEACVEGQTGFELAEECATPALCEASITYSGLRGSPRCVRPACAVGQHRCTGKILEICNDNRDGFRPIEECIGPPFCNAVAADNGGIGCEDAPCDPGEEQCNGAQIQRCRADQTDFDPVGAACDTRDLCIDDDPFNAFCRPPVCQRAGANNPLSTTEFRCQGTSLQRCNDQHTGYDTLNTCATPALCDPGFGFQGCRPPVCAPGETRCGGDFVQICNADRTGFQNLERCAPGTCDSTAGRCADPCVVGSARCNSQGQLEECRDRLVGREITARCLSPQLCDANARSCRQPPAGCTADGVRQCNRSGANTLLQVCADGRSRLNTLDTCAGSEICDVNNALCDVCNQNGAPTCQGNQLIRCAADGQSTTATLCPNGCVNGRCRTCVPGSASCQNEQMVVCVARGNEEFLERQNCRTAQRCQTELGACNAGANGAACQCEFCGDGDKGPCDGRFPTRCNATNTAFERVPGVSCNTQLDCDPNPGGQPCFVCGPGDVSCSNNNVLLACDGDRRGFNSPVPGASTPGAVRCTSDVSGDFLQQCSGGSLNELDCGDEGLLCDTSVSGRCVECRQNGFVSTCVGTTSHTVCTDGRETTVPCTTDNNCLQASDCTGNGACVFTSRAAGTTCTLPRGGGTGVCDGAANNPTCIPRCNPAACEFGCNADFTACNPCQEAQCGSVGCAPNRTSCNACTPAACAGRVMLGPCQQAACGGANGLTCVAQNACGTGQVCVNNACTSCGNGTVDQGEQCDGTAGVGTCGAGQGGTVTCRADCTRNTSGCQVLCGNGVVDSGEACDGMAGLGSCPAGFEGTPTCNDNCTRNTAVCTALCGNGRVDQGEQCDGTAGVGMCGAGQSGTPTCNANCTRNTSGCTALCGNGVVDQGEQCDGTAGVGTCGDGQSGTVTCNDNCTRNTNGCQALCGNGDIDPGEDCDGNDVSCPDGQNGNRSCNNCRIVGNCVAAPRCGDGSCNGGESTATCFDDCGSACGDGAVNGNERCEGNGVLGECGNGQIGNVTCNNCAEDRSACRNPTCQDTGCPAGQQCNANLVCEDIPAAPETEDSPGNGNNGNGNGNGNNGNGNGNGGPNPDAPAAQ